MLKIKYYNKDKAYAYLIILIIVTIHFPTYFIKYLLVIRMTYILSFYFTHVMACC